MGLFKVGKTLPGFIHHLIIITMASHGRLSQRKIQQSALDDCLSLHFTYCKYMCRGRSLTFPYRMTSSGLDDPKNRVGFEPSMPMASIEILEAVGNLHDCQLEQGDARNNASF